MGAYRNNVFDGESADTNGHLVVFERLQSCRIKKIIDCEEPGICIFTAALLEHA